MDKQLILNIIQLYNNIIELDNNNNDSYKLKIVFNYNEYDKIHNYIFYITKGYNENIIFKYTFNINNRDFIYPIFEKIIVNFSNKNNYLYTSRISNIFGNVYKIVLDNNINIEFIYQTDYDRIFFEQIYINKINKKTKKLLLDK